MDFWGDRRGQPVQIGFILLFGILVLAFASYQGYVVPSQNANIEVNHFETVEDQFAEFDTNVVNAVGTDVERSASFALSVQYPSRLVALNPPPVSGRLETTAPRKVAVENASGTDITSSVCGSNEATSRSLVYTPEYNEYREARSTTYENTFVTRNFRERDLHGDQRLVRSVDGGPDRIDLLLLNRSVSVDRQGTYSLKLQGTHRYSKRVENATVTIATQFSNTTWEEDILADRDDVSASDAGQGSVTLEFTGGDYEVSCAVVGLNDEPAFEPPASDSDDSSTFDTRWVEADGQSIHGDTVNVTTDTDSIVLTAQALERETSLPVEGALIDFSIEGQQDVGSFERGVQDRRTDGEGREDVEVNMANDAEVGDQFQVYVTIGDDTDVLTIQVEEAGGGGGGTMAGRTSYVAGSGTEVSTGVIEFEIQSTGNTVEITGLTVDSTTNRQADIVDNDGNREFEGAGGYANLESGSIDIGSSDVTDLDVVAEITDTTEAFSLAEFRKSSNNKRQGMDTEDVTITLHFSDGSSLTFTAENL